ncbi:Hypp1361 [Branchiostoma lanceolatum]|uniref:Hypp1361 protein n=1 Tax=Branchiostoma lanceolatum TaxID=7740 RepID=A0A8J9ZJP1_BRALA|nr:Hypp1361 [Branchiostoma lanceolatum]
MIEDQASKLTMSRVPRTVEFGFGTIQLTFRDYFGTIRKQSPSWRNSIQRKILRSADASLLAIDVEPLTRQLVHLIKKYVYVSKGEMERLWQKAALEIQREDSPRTSSEFAKEIRSSLFKNGITMKRIVVLIIFCRDLTVANLKQGRKERAADIVSWSVSFIGKWVSDWVAPNGGWAKVLAPPECQTNRLLYTAATVLILTCAAVGLGVLFQNKRLQ